MFKNIKTAEELEQERVAALIKSLEQAVDNHIDAECKSRGYRNADAIGKYLGYDNSCRSECESLGAWAASCYDKCYELLASGKELTEEELIEQLPSI